MEMSTAPPEGSIIVGKYRVEREIGSGGMGVVVEATHIALDQRVAIKLLNPVLASAPENVARFVREARVAAKLPSEHIARVHDVGQTEYGAPYLVMELLEGHDLATELVRRGRLRLSEAIDYVLQACEGIAEAHAASLVHRDLKPANLFLAQRAKRGPCVKVLDFGLSKEPLRSTTAAITTTGSVFGTPQYMSPEQFESAKNVDARSDQHAIAMILYELLTGQPAYNGDSLTQLILAIAKDPPPRASARCPEAPPALDAAICRALAKRADERFPNLSSFADAIAPFGGPSARAMAENIRATLYPRPDADVGPNITAAISGVEPTLLAGQEPPGWRVPAASPRVDLARSTDALTSSVDPVKRVRRSQRRAMAGGIMAVTAVVAGSVAFLVWTRPATLSSAATEVGSTLAGAALPAPTPTPRESAAPSATRAAEPTVSPTDPIATGAPTGSAATSAPLATGRRGAGPAPRAGSPRATGARPAAAPATQKSPNEVLDRFD